MWALLPAAAAAAGGLVPGFRPPCAPLNVVSPYQSVWSCADHLYDAWPQHWNGATIGMYGLLRVDGVTYRFMGARSDGADRTAEQRNVTVAATTTTYDFAAGGVALRVEFATPMHRLDDDIVNATRPVTHVTFTARSADGAAHEAELYYDNSAEGAVRDASETVAWSRPRNAGALTVMQVGTTEQKPLAQGSDTINWGYWLVATPTIADAWAGVHTAMNSAAACRVAFANGTYAGVADDAGAPRAARDRWPALSVAWDLRTLPARGDAAERHLALAYDQVTSQRYFGTEMPPLWRHRWATAAAMLEAAERTRAGDLSSAAAFDARLARDAAAAGGAKYATLTSLVFRQAVGGTQAVWNPVLREPWVFMKEISSDGDVSTVDVIYPAFPLFHYLYPEYFRRTLVPILVYGANGTKQYGMDMPYDLAWAPHHLGHWPVCDLAPSRQEQMPLEESGNVLIMLAGLYQQQQDAAYLQPYWPMLDSWADYVAASLPDPGDQLCTDDFEGPSPHNTNLAAKGVVALDAYAYLIAATGRRDKARGYQAQARAFAANWTAAAADAEHYRIQFNLPGSWSQKYNLLYQRVLGLGSFPESVFRKEEAYYATQMHACGLPLDDRHPYTKSDWSMWVAALGDEAQFAAITDAVYTFAHTTPSRVPLSDWYDTDSCAMKGFRARPVQGGFFAKMLVPR